MSTGTILRGFIVPGLPHPLLTPERSSAWSSLRRSFERVRREIEASGADLLVLYSTQWISVIGHQIQADPEAEWVHVDPEWHETGTMPYHFRMDAEFGKVYEDAARKRGLHARTVAYHGFPIDTGTVVALKLLGGSERVATGETIPERPENRIAASVVSCNMYADRAETLVLGKAAADAIRTSGRRAIAIAVTALSNRLFTHEIDPKDDHVSSPKDDEWNRKLLEILGEGRLEDVSQLAREFSAQANGDQKLKAVWWLAALMGEHNDYEGTVYDYQPIWGTGAALVGLVPVEKGAARLEFDEESVEVYAGDRNVLTGSAEELLGGRNERGVAAEPTPRPATAVLAEAAPKPVGAYPHARRVGDLLYLSGIGPRVPETNEVPGGPVRNADGSPNAYDIEVQTRQAIANVKTVLEAAGSSLGKVLDVTVFLIDMDRDFADFNRVYAELLGSVGATRTTLAVSALPTPIAVELKVIAAA